MNHRTKTPPTYLPVHKVKADPKAHVVMNPALREWLARKAAA